MGLDSHKQGVIWEDSEPKKKQIRGDNKNTADRYFSIASRHLLRSEPSVPVFPVTLDRSKVTNSTSFLPLGDPERDNGHAMGMRLRNMGANSKSQSYRQKLHIIVTNI